MKRRDFLKLGVIGTTGALLGWEGLAGRQKARGLYPFPPPYTGPWAVRGSRSPS